MTNCNDAVRHKKQYAADNKNNNRNNKMQKILCEGKQQFKSIHGFQHPSSFYSLHGNSCYYEKYYKDFHRTTDLIKFTKKNIKKQV